MRSKYQTLSDYVANNGEFWDHPVGSPTFVQNYLNKAGGKDLHQLLIQYNTPYYGDNTIWVSMADPFVYEPTNLKNYLLGVPENKVVAYFVLRDIVIDEILYPALDKCLLHFQNTGKLKNYFIISTVQEMSKDIVDRYKDVATFYTAKKEALAMWHDLGSTVEEFDRIKSSKNIQKHFLSLNNRGSWDRQALFYFINNFNLLEKAYFSYQCQSYNRTQWAVDYDRLDTIIGSDLWFTNNIDRKNLKQMLPYTINNSGVASDHFFNNPDYYTQSFCSVVMETYHHLPNDFVFTEKILKPLLYEHPFLLFSSCGALAQLKELGFETFSDVFNESYDTIIEPSKRLEAIFRELLRISQWSLAECTAVHNKIESKLKYNKKVLLDHYLNNNYNVLDEICSVIKNRALTYIPELLKNV